MIPIVKNQGIIYKKSNKIKARKAKGGEKITTITKDGIETVNIANPGDFVIENQTNAKEKYIISGRKFLQRYLLERKGKNDWSYFKPIGKIIAVKVTKDLLTRFSLGKEFYFIASWGEKMIVKQNDMLVLPSDFSEIYRIAKTEFMETFEKVT